MTNVRLTPDAHPSQIEKTLRYQAPHTSEVVNRIQEELVGSTRVLRGLEIVQSGDGEIKVQPGSFIAGGVIVTLKTALTLDYSDQLDANGNLARSSGRKKSLILYAHCSSSSEFSPVTFGFVYDVLEQSVLVGDLFVRIAVLQSSDEMSVSDDAGRWTRPYGFSLEELARDSREGVQTIEAIPFASDTGVLRPDPDLRTGPYFTDDRQILVFADRMLLPSEALQSSSPCRYSRRDIRGISETGVDAAAFDFGGQHATALNVVGAQWGIVVSRDIRWQQATILTAAQSEVPVASPNSIDAGSGRLLVFRDGLWLAPSEYAEASDKITLVTAGSAGEVLHLVHFDSVVFLETMQVTRDSLDEDTDVAQDLVLTLSSHLYDRTRHSLLVFARLSGAAVVDGGYLQINRVGTGTRTSQKFICRDGFEMVDGGSIRLKGVTIASSTTVTIGILCVRGSTKLNFQSADRTQITPFFKRWEAVADSPSEGQIQAFPTLYGFVAAAPGGSPSVSVALHDVSSSFVADDGTVIESAHFEGYTLLQGSAFEDEAGTHTSPRSVQTSAAPTYGTPSNFSTAHAQVTLTVPLGAQSAVAGSPVKLKGGRTLSGLPPYAIGEQKLRVAINGVRLISGVDFEEVTDTSAVIRHPLAVGDFLEAWTE